MPADITDPSGIEYALESKKGPSEENALVLRRESIRHSASHIMAEAVRSIFPEAKFAIGPPTEDGFYYDFQLPRALTDDDLPVIEKKMAETVAADLPFQRTQVSRPEAGDMFRDQPFKLEIINAIKDDILGIYTHGPFSDLCNGPHVESTGGVPAFKLLSVAGAYWRGDENRPMLQRIYGTAFESQDALDLYLNRLEEAAKRDHRKLGRELGLFSVHNELGAGLICWHPKGARVRSLVEDFWRELHLDSGYSLVYSPHIGKSKLWETSGHLQFYSENMYAPVEIDEQDYYLKPMNCPFHILMYRSSLRSYRELPMRLAELGTVYRYERTGVLHGLLRVRGFTQDDAHIFCRPDQLEDEVRGVLELTFRLLGAFGFSDYKIFLSDRPEKYVGEQSEWDTATSRRSAQHPRGHGHQLPGRQRRRGILRPQDRRQDRRRHRSRVAMHHRTVRLQPPPPLRAVLYSRRWSGAQAVHGPPGDPRVHGALHGHTNRALRRSVPRVAGPDAGLDSPDYRPPRRICPGRSRPMTAAGLRIEVDDRGERMNRKIRDAQLNKVPYMLIVGDKEVAAETLSVRKRNGENLGPQPLASVIEMLQTDIADRT